MKDKNERQKIKDITIKNINQIYAKRKKKQMKDDTIEVNRKKADKKSKRQMHMKRKKK